jgi:hypothetical protein
MSSRTSKSERVLIGFLLCGVCDFVFGFARMGSILGGIVAVVVGLPLSAVIVFTLLGVIDRKDQGRTDDSHGQH